MPASDPLPSIRNLLTSSANAVVGTRQSVADTRRGSIYDHFAGSGAILVTREAARDRNLFRAVYLDTAEGDDLTRLVKLRFGIDRIVPSYGTGKALLTRARVAAGGGTIWEGTRSWSSRARHRRPRTPTPPRTTWPLALAWRPSRCPSERRTWVRAAP